MSVYILADRRVYLQSSIHFFFRVPKHLGKRCSLNKDNKRQLDLNVKPDPRPLTLIDIFKVYEDDFKI